MLGSFSLGALACLSASALVKGQSTPCLAPQGAWALRDGCNLPSAHNLATSSGSVHPLGSQVGLALLKTFIGLNFVIYLHRKCLKWYLSFRKLNE